MCDIIGRKREIAELRRYYDSGRAEFVAVYGRRRVGKTFLIDEVFHDIGPAPRNPQLILNLFAFVGAWLRRDAIASYVCIRLACGDCNT